MFFLKEILRVAFWAQLSSFYFINGLIFYHKTWSEYFLMIAQCSFLFTSLLQIKQYPLVGSKNKTTSCHWLIKKLRVTFTAYVVLSGKRKSAHPHIDIQFCITTICSSSKSCRSVMIRNLTDLNICINMWLQELMKDWASKGK